MTKYRRDIPIPCIRPSGRTRESRLRAVAPSRRRWRRGDAAVEVRRVAGGDVHGVIQHERAAVDAQGGFEPVFVADPALDLRGLEPPGELPGSGIEAIDHIESRIRFFDTPHGIQEVAFDRQ